MGFLQRIPESLGWLLIILLIGLATGNSLLLWNWSDTPQVQFFTSTPEFLIWLSLVSVLFAILPICALYGLMVIFSLRPKVTAFPRRSLFSLLLLVILFFAPYMTMANFPEILPPVDLPSFQVRVNLVTLFCGVCSLPAAASLLLLQHFIQTLNPQAETFPKAYFQAKEQLRGLLGAIGLIIGLGTLTTGALQNALTVLYTEFAIANDKAFPPILTVVYGGYFSIILILIYWPLERSLLERAEQFLDARLPLPAVDAANWAEIYSTRQKASAWLDLDTAWLNIRSALAIFTPLASGLISYLLPG